MNTRRRHENLSSPQCTLILIKLKNILTKYCIMIHNCNRCKISDRLLLLSNTRKMYNIMLASDIVTKSKLSIPIVYM